MSDDLKLDTKNLDGILKALKGNMVRARIGVLGGNSMRNNVSSSGKINVKTNATIGSYHEFGVPGKLPMRSFLRVPISEHLQSELESKGAFTDKEMKRVIGEGSVIPWLERIAVVAYGIVMEAFDTGGFGKWPKWSQGYSNNTGQILVDTQQLRNSITTEVK